MPNSITIQPEQFIFAQNHELKTTSLKVSEAFNRLHKNVIAKIESLDCSKQFHELNFKPMQIDIEIGNNAKRKSLVYEMTKDGFMFLVMGFTGKKADAIKEAYILAFNAMAERLLVNRQPIPQEKKTLQSKKGCLTLEQQDTIKNIVRSTAEALPKEDRASTTIKMWSAIKTKFGCSYKDVSHDEFNNIISLLARLPIEGELLPPTEPPQKSVTISLDTIAKDERYLVSSNNGSLHLWPLGKEVMFLRRDEIVDKIDELVPGHRIVPLALYNQIMALQKQIELMDQ